MARPRNQTRDQDAIAATRELLATVGYHGFSMNDVARTIGSSKNTLYRRWPSKASLVAASITEKSTNEVAAYPSLRDALIALAQSHLCAEDGHSIPVLAGVFWAMRADQELADVVRREIAETRLTEFHQALQSAQQRGELADVPPHWRQIGQLLPAALMYRFAVDQPIDGNSLVQIIDTILLPLIHDSTCQ
ncbi:Putative regulatory protein, TetR family [Mycobacteroides abscessus subsp. abscessus]|uniref:TetR/AcrR family transcriptional regulator n=1 Tax=Mycobacteroides abscessus TaxID=36809 RepID=UPI0009283921|nr:TetR/AcrR family transcriptional regulator [Mycobacteroides abscessus]MDO3104576.1 TetR/AcrR family transcriptional regulator [Mycobacteroides abscessus subsp. abscessus]SIJ40130.1 Putative regulatory protein, TetR family [Mycobacteroides abscessus subsp. abscessus]SIN46027.1 transcriptional regulator [Mycobacteroides abscessus subsp. abscessus]SKE50141.1 Putative regulatory protein, TetR family [Mycobacteroides abscessus subsp. abscessus]SLG38815.1 Putative regulatory protein, TetR family 